MSYLFLHCRALGQGAFGEVYEGTYKKSGNGGGEMTVAVKTLAELRTNQVCPLSNNLCLKGGRRAMGFRRSKSYNEEKCAFSKKGFRYFFLMVSWDLNGSPLVFL